MLKYLKMRLKIKKISQKYRILKNLCYLCSDFLMS